MPPVTTDSACTIRPCKSDDLSIVNEMFSALYVDNSPPADPSDLPSRLSPFFLVAERGDRIVGFIIAEHRRTNDLRDEMGKDAFPSDKEYLEIQELYVQPVHRRQGIGSKLVRTVLEQAHKQGIERSMVYSGVEGYYRHLDTFFDIAKFYEKCGYRMWHIFMTR
jgi:GNAT superfamily N-acetyltransferase